MATHNVRIHGPRLGACLHELWSETGLYRRAALPVLRARDAAGQAPGYDEEAEGVLFLGTRRRRERAENRTNLRTRQM